MKLNVQCIIVAQKLDSVRKNTFYHRDSFWLEFVKTKFSMCRHGAGELWDFSKPLQTKFDFFISPQMNVELWLRFLNLWLQLTSQPTTSVLLSLITPWWVWTQFLWSRGDLFLRRKLIMRVSLLIWLLIGVPLLQCSPAGSCLQPPACIALGERLLNQAQPYPKQSCVSLCWSQKILVSVLKDLQWWRFHNLPEQPLPLHLYLLFETATNLSICFQK